MLFVTSRLRNVRIPVSPLPRSERSSSGTLERPISPRMVRSSPSSWRSSEAIARLFLVPAHEGLHPVQGDREEDRGVLLRRDLGERLEVAEVEGRGLLLER